MKDIPIFDGERIDKVNENVSLISKKDGLIFGTDAYLLAAFIRPQPSARAVELGTGTGIISLLLSARNRVKHIYAIEVQADFAELAERNVKINSFEEKIDIIHSDIRNVSADDVGGEVDIVFANPPYMRADSGKRNESDRKYIARHEVEGGIDDFCRCAYKLLKHGGRFYCVWRPDRMSELIASLSANHLEPKAVEFVHANSDSEPSIMLVSATKGGAHGMRVMPPLLLNDERSESETRKMSERANKIYDTMSFYD